MYIFMCVYIPVSMAGMTWNGVFSRRAASTTRGTLFFSFRVFILFLFYRKEHIAHFLSFVTGKGVLIWMTWKGTLLRGGASTARCTTRKVQRFWSGLVFKAPRLCVSLIFDFERNKEEEQEGTTREGRGARFTWVKALYRDRVFQPRVWANLA